VASTPTGKVARGGVPNLAALQESQTRGSRHEAAPKVARRGNRLHVKRQRRDHAKNACKVAMARLALAHVHHQRRAIGFWQRIQSIRRQQLGGFSMLHRRHTVSTNAPPVEA
jgi:hypothetical protein